MIADVLDSGGELSSNITRHSNVPKKSRSIVSKNSGVPFDVPKREKERERGRGGRESIPEQVGKTDTLGAQAGRAAAD